MRRIDKPDERFRVVVEDGVYRITEPVLFEVGDGNVVYEAAPGASPILSGGQRIISKWTKVADADGLWECDLSSGKRFEQLWVNGTRAIRAREPDSFFHYL
ncbi:MAG: right-handed parallel beta-helix repeat-containing protein, partial [Rhodopirellula sp. JB053]